MRDCRWVPPEEGGDDVKSAWPLRLGLHTRYNGRRNAERRRKPEQIAKTVRSSDWGLQLAPMKAELLVTACQQSAVNTYPGLVHTARHVMGVGNT
jgi:hypothetical protein